MPAPVPTTGSWVPHSGWQLSNWHHDCSLGPLCRSARSGSRCWTRATRNGASAAHRKPMPVLLWLHKARATPTRNEISSARGTKRVRANLMLSALLKAGDGLRPQDNRPALDSFDLRMMSAIAHKPCRFRLALPSKWMAQRFSCPLRPNKPAQNFPGLDVPDNHLENDLHRARAHKGASLGSATNHGRRPTRSKQSHTWLRPLSWACATLMAGAAARVCNTCKHDKYDPCSNTQCKGKSRRRRRHLRWPSRAPARNKHSYPLTHDHDSHDSGYERSDLRIPVRVDGVPQDLWQPAHTRVVRAAQRVREWEGGIGGENRALRGGPGACLNWG